MVSPKLAIQVGAFVAVVIVLIIVFKKFNIGETIQDAIDGTKKFFEENFGSLGDLFGEPDSTSSLSGTTVTLEDGTKFLIPQDNVVNEDGTVSGSPPLLDLTDEDEARVLQTIRDNKKANEQFTEILKTLDSEQLLTISGTLNKIAQSGSTIFTDDGFILQGFTSGETARRIAQQFQNLENEQTTSFGGFDSALDQELALREAIEEQKKLFPEFFK